MRDLWWCEVCGSRDAPYSDPYLSPPPAPSSPFDLAQPNVFSELLTQIQQNPCGFSGGERSLWDSYISQYGIKKKTPRVKLSGEYPHQDLTRG